MNYKVSTYLPADCLQGLVSSLREIVCNRIGNYCSCLSWYPVRSTWTSLEGATPYIGRAGEVSVEDEMKLEFLCAEADLARAIRVIRRFHPYEEPVIDIVPMYTAYEIYPAERGQAGEGETGDEANP